MPNIKTDSICIRFPAQNEHQHSGSAVSLPCAHKECCLLPLSHKKKNCVPRDELLLPAVTDSDRTRHTGVATFKSKVQGGVWQPDACIDDRIIPMCIKSKKKHERTTNSSYK